MDKFFEHMDDRFKSIESEMKFNYSDDLWKNAEEALNNSELDNAFVNAASQSNNIPKFDFNDIDDAFLDDAFVNAANATKFDYNQQYWSDFAKAESVLYQNDAFVTAAALNKVVYDTSYWKDADLALQAEGLHHEYKPVYWKEAEKLLLKENKKGFFIRWGSAAAILLLFSFLTYQWSDANQMAHSVVNENQSTEKSTEPNFNLAENSTISNAGHNAELSVEVKDNTANESTQNEVLATKDASINSNQSNQNQVNAFSTKKTSHFINQQKVNHNLELSEKNLPQANQFKVMDDPNITKSIDLVKLNPLHESVVKVEQPTQTEILEDQFIDIQAPLDLKPMHILSIEAGKGIGNNFNNNGEMSFRNMANLSYKFIPANTKLNRFNLGLDLGIYHQNLNNYEYEQNVSVYHLQGDVDHYWYKMTYKDLVFASTKFNVYFNATPNHIFKLGIGADRLITSRISMQYQEMSDQGLTNQNNQWGLNTAINKVDFSLNLGYEFKINDKFNFTVNAKHGIMDRTNNDYLHRDQSDIDKSIILGLKYNFLRF